MFKLLRYLKFTDFLLIILIAGLTFLQVYLEFELIGYMGEIISLIQKNMMIPNFLTNDMLFDVGINMILVSLGIAASAIVATFFGSLVTGRLSKTLRSKVFCKVNNFSNEEIGKFKIPSLITRNTNDIKQIEQSLLTILRIGLLAPIMASYAITEIFTSSMTLSYATLVAVGVLILIMLFMFLVVLPKFAKVQKKTDAANSVARESLTGIRVVRAYNNEKSQQDKFEVVNEDLTKNNLFIGRATSFLMPSLFFIMYGLNLAIYWIGATLINNASLQYSTLAVFTQQSAMVVMSFMMISMLFVIIPRGVTSAKRVNEVLKQQSKIVDGEIVCQNAQSVVFNNVSFRYPDAKENVLENITFTANKGETIAFIGSTGSGKSTLVNLLVRFFDVTDGEILIGEDNIKNLNLNSLNDKIGYIPQKANLFSGTVKSNMQFGNKDATDIEIEKALKIAQADFVFKYEDKLDHEISQGGSNVSGGQRQRLAIARAIVKNPDIFIFDDSFSALDYKTDKKLRAELEKVCSDKINIIIAQRVGTIMQADKIIVLDEGKIVGSGTHKQLLKNCAVYKDIALSQLSKEELNGK